MKNFLVIIGILCLGWSSILAQTVQVSGTVTDAEDGQPLPGVSVVVKGTVQGTVTDTNGKYTIAAPADAILLFSFIGMTTQDISIAGRQVINVELQLSAHEIDEVIVVAYGTAKKSSFTGSASTVKSEQLSARSVSNVTNALSGQTAGVQVSNTGGGQPGTGATIRIRGFGSLTASSAPLYVVDGSPFEGNISSINTSDIESMTVLKDAAANAIYGARGANGVILITTKKGGTREAKVTVDAKWGTNGRAVPNYTVMTSPAMYYETLYKSLYNSRIYTGNSEAQAHTYADANLYAGSGGAKYLVYTFPEGQNLVGTNFKLNPNATLGYYDGQYYYQPDDWYKESFKSNNLRQEYYASVSGMADKLNYYVSAGYLDDTGIIPSSGFTRFSGLAKADYQAKKWLKIGANLIATQYNMQAPSDQTNWGSTGNLFYNTNLIAPIYPMYVRGLDANGQPYIMKDEQGNTMYDYGNSTNFVRNFLVMANPLGSLALDKYNMYLDALISKWYAIFTPVEGLTITANLGANLLNRRYSYLFNPYHGSAVGANGQVVVEHDRDVQINQQYLASYAKTFGGRHNIDILAGFETYEWTMQSLGGSRQNLYNPWVGELNNGIQWPPTDMYSSTNKYVTKGFLSRVLYNYDEKYFVSASYRHDGSSRFHPDNRWGNFGSGGLAWLISEEDFFYSLKDQVNMLKLKVSYGVQGNDNLSSTNFYNYAGQRTIQNDGNDGFSIVPGTTMGNKDITWETSYTWNAGADFEFFNLLSGSIEYFYRTTVNMLYNKPMPVSSGYRFMPINALDMVNHGLEVDLAASILKERNIQWDVFANLTWFRNKITNIPLTANATGQITDVRRILKKGGSIYNAYMAEFVGVNVENGKALFTHNVTNNDGEIIDVTTTDDQTEAEQFDLGPTYAPWYGGFGTTVKAYGFDFSVQFAYQMGGKLYDDIYQELMHSGRSDMSGYNWHKDILNSWTPENTNTNIPRLASSDDTRQFVSSRFLTSSNYLSLNSIVLGYNFPEKWLKKANIANLRLFVSGDNVAVFTKRKGFDPRANIALGGPASDNSSGTMYSLLRTFSGGISITF